MSAAKENNLLDVFDKFETYSQELALIDFTQEKNKELTFIDLIKLVRRLAAGLNKLGIEKQEPVMLIGHSSKDLVIASLAIIYAGAIVVPVDMQSSDEILAHIISDSAAKTIFVDTKGLERLSRLSKKKGLQLIRLDDESQSNHWRQIIPHKAGPNHLEIGESDLCVLFYTSGTTGLPKGVPLSHGNIIAQIQAVIETKLLTRADRVLLPLPLFHVYPFVVGLLSPLALVCTVILPKSVTGPEIIRSIKEGEATVLIAVPRLLRALYTAIEKKARSNNIDSTAFDTAATVSKFAHNIFKINIGKLLFKKLHKRFPSLRLLACGGALLDPELADQLITLGWQVAVGYGLTETSPLLTARMPSNHDLKGVGKPIQGVQIRIEKIVENTKEARKPDANEESKNTDDKQLEIQVKGKGIFSGYHNLPEKTAESFTEDGWFKTGDTGFMSHNNLHVTGRISTTLKSEGGKKIQPEEIEKTYENNPAIREIGILQDKQKLVALVVPNITAIGHADPHEKIAEVIKSVSSSQPSYYRISDFAITKDQLPRTNLGKIRRPDLIAAYEKAKTAEQNLKSGKQVKEELSPQDKALLEEPLAKETWEWLQERFPDAEITFTKSPQLDLNVDSLEWLNLTLEIQQRFGVELNEEAIGRIDVIRDLIREIVEAAKAGTNKVSPLEKPENFLDDDQKNWLEPLGPCMLFMACILYWTNYILMRLCFRISGVNTNKIPKEQVVFIPNHSSYLDAFALSAVLDLNRLQKTQWAGWIGIALANPFNAFIYRLTQAIPIDANRSLISSLALAAAVLKQKRNLVWFPEGELTPNGKLLPFKSGIGTLLLQFPVKAVPIRIIGTYEALPHGAIFPHFNKVNVVFGDPVSPEELLKEGNGNTDAERIANALHDRVNKLSLDNNK